MRRYVGWRTYCFGPVPCATTLCEPLHSPSCSSAPEPSDAPRTKLTQKGAWASPCSSRSGVSLDTVSYSITGPASFARSGTIDVSHSADRLGHHRRPARWRGLHDRADVDARLAARQCAGSAPFSVTAGATTGVTVHLQCHEAPTTGSVLVNGTINQCAVVDGLSASPAEVRVGGSIALAARRPRQRRRAGAPDVPLDGQRRHAQRRQRPEPHVHLYRRQVRSPSRLPSATANAAPAPRRP